MDILLSCSITLVLNVGLGVGNDKGCGTGHLNPSVNCCSGYIKIENTCTECIGFYGKDCSTKCPSGFYGKLCKEECRCNETETCDPYAGCVTNNVKCTWNEAQTPFWISSGNDRMYEFLTIHHLIKINRGLLKAIASGPNNRLESNDVSTSQDYSRGWFVPECKFVLLAAIGIIVFQILTLIFASLLCIYRHRRHGKYEIQNIMAKSTDSPHPFQELQLIRYEELEDNVDYIPKSMKEHTYHKVHQNQITRGYSRVTFPKFKTVDTPADQYSRTVINRQHIYEHRSNTVCSIDQDKVNMRRKLRLSSVDQHSLRGTRPYSFARTTWNL